MRTNPERNGLINLLEQKNMCPPHLARKTEQAQADADTVQTDRLQADKVKADKVKADKVKASRVQTDKVQKDSSCHIHP